MSALLDATPVMDEASKQEARNNTLAELRPPRRIPGYEQEKFLGRGAFGEVWVAVDSNSGRKVAIKYFHRRGGLDWSLLSREVEKLRYLFGDRHVVQLLQVGWESDPPFYVMEYMERGSLEDLIRDGPLPADQALTVFREVATGLAHAHGKGVLHCDLKPANVMLDQDGQPRLADFGQSRLSHEHTPALGTLFYMAPEQADLKASPDVRWDVYALGALMFRMLTGEAPFRTQEAVESLHGSGTLEDRLGRYRHLLSAAQPPSAHRATPGVDSALATIIDKCLALNPKHRFANIQAVLSALDARTAAHARQPLLILGGLGPLLVMLVVLAAAGAVFRKTVAVAHHEVMERAAEGNRFAAKAEATRLGEEVRTRWEILLAEAKDPKVRGWLSLERKLKGSSESKSLNAWMRDRQRHWELVVPGAKASLWFADDRLGFQRGCSEPDPDHPGEYVTREAGVLDVYFGWRDYFHGLGRNLAVTEFQEEPSLRPKPIDHPHRSVVYRRKLSSTWVVAYTVPVPSLDPNDPEPVGVLGMTSELVGPTRLPGERDRFFAMIDRLPDSSGKPGLIIRHPYQEAFRDNPTALPLHYCVDSASDRFFQDDYQDPVGGVYGGRDWLTVGEPVVVPGVPPERSNTGWTMLVQEDRLQAMKPVDDLRSTLAGYGVLTLGIVALVLSLLWGFVMVVLNAAPSSRLVQFLRKRVGLRSGASATSSSSSDEGSLRRSGLQPGTKPHG
ncbi:MAG: serine/threonine-protein kinase [Gemmataceae bacterium]